MKAYLPCSLYKLLSISFLLLHPCLFGQIADYGKSYFNVSKGVNGGTVAPGDTLEIRASLVVRNTGFFDSCAFFDVIPTGTAYITGTVRVLTNEGKIYKQFTDAQFGALLDEGWIAGTNVRINLGYNQTDAPATVYRRGRIRNTHKPSFYGSSCIMVASYRVRVTAGYGTVINLGGGSLTYKLGANPLTTTALPSNPVMIYNNIGICPNSIGANALGTEFNGSFGGGKPRNRGTSANVPPSYTYAVFDVNTPNDYFYGIANNTSTRPNYTTLNTWAKPDVSSPTHRVFQVWDIIGDHTGAVSSTLGNPAADTVNNNNAGYMLVINASYRIDSAFQHVISNLCPNTYYEISCWMRNICSKCGCDSNGRGASGGAGYIPTATGDSSGVYPSIIFEIDGIDYYSSGQLRYTGQWVKKAFTFLTGPAQTSFTLKFKNNAPGGGGNDWALDDIAVATCTPNLMVLPGPNPFICDSNLADLSATVKSYFNNYTYYKWQRSTDGGSVWNDVSPPGGPATPVWNGAEWEYTVTFPSFITTMADSGHKYRVVVATTLANLANPNCRFTDAANIITLTIDPCNTILNTSITYFTGRLVNRRPVLNWGAVKEETPVKYEIEKSTNGRNYSMIAVVNGRNDPAINNNDYTFTDAALQTELAWYRIKITDLVTGEFKYSRIILLVNSKPGIILHSVLNPFSSELRVDFIADENGMVQAELTDQLGNPLQRKQFPATRGINNFSIRDIGILPAGVYMLRLASGSNVVTAKVIKQNR
jgi:hypothetical protein